MALISQLPRRIRLLLGVLAINLVIFSGLRFAFWIAFHTPDNPISIDILLKSFFIGFKFDLRLALLLVFPMLILSWIPGINPVHSSKGRQFWAFHLSILISIIILFYFIDFGNYAYLEERADASTLRYFQNPVISLRMVWETYPVIWGISSLLVFGVLYFLVLRKLMSKSMKGESTFPARWKKILIISLSTILYLSGIYGKISYYPLRWSDAFSTTHRFASDLALNPVLYFFDTLCTAEDTKYEKQEVNKYYDKMVSYWE